MSPTRSHPSVDALFPEWLNSTLYHPQLDESLYKTWELIILGILAGFFSVVTICGNLTVLMSFFLERSIRQPSNYFIASLAVSDLLIGTISMPLYTTYILTWKNWPLGEILCDLWLSIDYTACLCSIYTIFCITIDRFCSIKLPTKYRVWRTERKVLFVVFLTWAIPVIVFFTSIFGWQHFVGRRTVPRGKCYVQYMDDAFFNCFLQVGYFWTTLIAMFVLYAGIYRVALDLHRRSDEKRRRHLNSLATMAGCTIGQLGTVIGMSHCPKRELNVGSVPTKEPARTGSPNRVPDNGYHSREVRTISETVNVTSESQRELVPAASPVQYHPDKEIRTREVETKLETINVTRDTAEVLFPTNRRGYQLRESNSAVCVSPKKLLQVSPTRQSDSGVNRRQLRPTTESITPLKAFMTRKRYSGKHRRNSELSLTAAAFFKAVEHIQECLLLSAGQSATRGNLDLPRGRDVGEKTVEDRTRNAAVNSRSSNLCGSDDAGKRETTSCVFNTRSYSLCSDSPKRRFATKQRNGRNLAELHEQRLPTSIPFYLEANAELASGISDPQLVISPKFANLARNNGRNLTKRQTQPLLNLIPSDSDVNAELVAGGGYSDPDLVVSQNSADPARTDAEIAWIAVEDSHYLEQGMGQIKKSDIDNRLNIVRCFDTDAQMDPRANVRNRKSLMLRRYRTETHLECFKLGSCSRSRFSPEDRKTALDNRGFLEGEETRADLPRSNSLRFCVSEVVFPQDPRVDSRCERSRNLLTFDAPLPKGANQVLRENDSIILERNQPDPELDPAMSTCPKHRTIEDPSPAYEIFYTQTSSEHPVSEIKTDRTKTIPDDPVPENTPVNPIQTIFHARLSPESATSVPTSQPRGDDVNNYVSDDVTNSSREPRTNEKNLDYLKVPGLEVTATPMKQRHESGNEIREHDPGFDARFPPGFKRLLQGSRRGQDGGMEESRRRPSEKQIKNENRARKALRTITIILGAFVMCWTPWHVLSLIIGFCSTSVVCVSPVLYDISYWLCYLNSPINPFCYAFVNQQFKKTFVRVLRLRWHRT